MTYLQFIKHITGPLGVAVFPSSGNLYYDNVRIGYLDFNRHSEEQEVNFFRPVCIQRIFGSDYDTEEGLRDIVKQLTALALIHDIPLGVIGEAFKM